jgi:hypothetical protein
MKVVYAGNGYAERWYARKARVASAALIATKASRQLIRSSAKHQGAQPNFSLPTSFHLGRHLWSCSDEECSYT